MGGFYIPIYKKLRQAVAVLQWGHNLLLLDKTQSSDAVSFYAGETLAKGWSRDLLLNVIKKDSLGQAQKQLKTNNFGQTPPETHTDYANEVFRSTYNLGISGITKPMKELLLENRLIAKIWAFIIDQGK